MTEVQAPDYLIELFGKSHEDFSKVPVLDLREKMGSTDYIDFLTPDDLSDAEGVDKHRRSFITFVIQEKKNFEKSKLMKILFPDNLRVLTLFQRYTDQNGFWVNGSVSAFGSHYSFRDDDPYCLRGTIVNLESDVYTYLKQIIDGTHKYYFSLFKI